MNAPGSPRTSQDEANASTELRSTGRCGAAALDSTEEARCTAPAASTTDTGGAAGSEDAPPRAPADAATVQSRRPPPGT
eukprot:3917101-Pyramimonas_sp.AAC.1